MSSSLKSRVKRLEEATGIKDYGGIVIYFENEVNGTNADGHDVIVSADYYLNEDRSEPITQDEINELNKQMIVYLPIRDENPQYHVIETDTQ